MNRFKALACVPFIFVAIGFASLVMVPLVEFYVQRMKIRLSYPTSIEDVIRLHEGEWSLGTSKDDVLAWLRTAGALELTPSTAPYECNATFEVLPFRWSDPAGGLPIMHEPLASVNIENIKKSTTIIVFSVRNMTLDILCGDELVVNFYFGDDDRLLALGCYYDKNCL